MHLSRGSTKQAKLAMMLLPSKTSTSRQTNSMRATMIQVGLTPCWRWRKVSDSCSSIQSILVTLATLLLSWSNCFPKEPCTIHSIYIYNMDYEQYYSHMNQTYSSIFYWPQPFSYHSWYHQLSPEQQTATMHPDYYNCLYEYGLQRNRQSVIQGKTKPTRSQKRREKKRAMKEELERETKQIGKWVKYERKDLIEGIEKIQKQEQKKKDHKHSKLSHLIEIHKEVAQQYRKKEASKGQRHKRVNNAAKKKRLSYIKKMKDIFEQRKAPNLEKVEEEEEEWENQPQKQEHQSKGSDDEDEHAEEEFKQKKESKVEIISYDQVGKLTGRVYNQIVLREWVTNYPNEALEDITLRVVNRLAFKQAMGKVKKQDKAKKIIVSGIKECKRTMKTIIDKKRSQLLVVALNIERNNLKKGVDDEVQQVIQLAQKINIPILHTSTRAKLGRAFTGKFGPRLTMVSVINYEGYQDMVGEMLQEWKRCCQKYETLP